MRLAALALCALLGGCANAVRVGELGLPRGSVELADTPFFPQEVNQCGPAALATALAASGVAVTPDQLSPELYLPGKKGSLQAEMVASARRSGRVPYPLQPDLAELFGMVADGTPVLVFQNLALSWYPIWHYSVVVGYDAQQNVAILRSGTDQRRLMKMGPFARSWRLAGYWALAVVDPSAPPARARLFDWLKAASAFEELKQPDVAARAYAAATKKWPDAPLAWQALANARYAQHDLPGAEQALRQAQKLEPAAATLNNLAQVLLEQGCVAAARKSIGEAAALGGTPPEQDAIARTRAQIDAAKIGSESNCSGKR